MSDILLKAPPLAALVRLATPERRRILLCCIGLYAGLIALWFFGREIASGEYTPDFTALWTAARAPREAIYDGALLTRLQGPLAHFSAPRPFAYPPTLLPFIAPFGRLAFWPALALWSGVGVAAFAASAAARLTRRELLLMALFPAVSFAAVSGQTSLILGAAVATAVFVLPERPRLAGALLGLVAAIKPQLVLLAPLALAFQPAALASFAAAGLATAAAALALYGPQVWLSWLHAAPGFLRVVSTEPYIVSRNLSPASAMIAAGLGPAWLIRLIWGIAGAALVGLAFRKAQPAERRLAALAVGSFLCSPYVMPYDAAVLAPAAVMLLRRPFAPAVLGFLMLPYTPWVGAAACGGLGLALLWEQVRPAPLPEAVGIASGA